MTETRAHDLKTAFWWSSFRGALQWNADEKLRIVLAGMQPGVEVSELCRREGINPTMYYFWRKKLLGSAKRVFDDRESRPSPQEERREVEVRRLKDVVAEITAENLE